MLKWLCALLLVAAPLSAQTVSQTRAQVPPSTAMQTNVSANANGTAVQVGGYSSALIVVTASVGMSGGTTINFECQSNGTFGAVSALKMGTTTVATTTTTTGDYQIAVGSYQSCRARISAYSAGTMTVVGYPSVLAPAAYTITSTTGGGGAAVTIADGADVAQGTTTDAKSTATDATGVTLMQVFKEISFMEQNPASRAVTNAGTFAVQAAQSGTWTVQPGNTANTTAWKVDGSAVTQPISGTVTANAGSGSFSVVGTGIAGTPAGSILTVQGVTSMTKLLTTPDLPPLASTSTKQSDGSQKTQIVDGSGNVIASTSNNLNVQCANCSGSGASAADAASFTAGASTFAPSGGFFQTTATSNPLTTGQQGFVQMTAQRAFFVNFRNASGTEIGTASTPIQVSLANTAANGTAVTVSGTVTANAGTNLNTSLLALEGGGNLATVAGAVIAQEATTSGVKGVTAFGAVTTNAPTYTTAKSDALSLDTSGLLRVSLKDTPANTNKFLVTPDSVALPANQSVNVSQINAVTPLMGNGASGTGAQRVTIANDSTGIISLTTGAATIGSLVANQSVNVAQVNGVTTLTGVGASGTGAQRVNDVASGTTGSAPPAQAAYQGGVTSGATGGLLTGGTICDSQGYLDMTTATTTEIAPLVSSRTIYVCSVVAMANGTTTMTFKRGTGSNCGTGTTSVSPAFDLTAQTGFAMGNGAGVVLGAAGAGTAGGATTASNALCVTSSGAVNLHVLIRYAVY